MTTLAAELLRIGSNAEDLPAFIDTALSYAADQLGVERFVWCKGERGYWRSLGAAETTPLPADLLGDCLDQERAVHAGAQVALPLNLSAGEVLLGFACDLSNEHLSKLADALCVSRDMAARSVGMSSRIERLETILEIAGQWNQAMDMESLLTLMAEASTRLLKAERASIFLWDRPNKQLVGRPALGVEGGELRIPDDTGIVGQVVQLGEPRRVDTNEDQREINRDVDQQLDFQTRSLLCVPLRSRGGERFGAFEMINKIDGNFSDTDLDALEELATHAAIALENTQEHEQLIKAHNQMTDQAADEIQLIGECPALEALRSTVQRVADTELAVLILGENGTGKEVVSRMLHYRSRRRQEPLIAVNCAALTESLLESELFGHEKGAFTDAHESRAGKFELASGGTLFLDEIGDMSLNGQAKLLRVLEEKVVVRVGGSVPIHTDARVIAATNRNLAEMVREKKFREDLYFRLHVVTLDLPPLRERGDDIMVLAEFFLRSFCIHSGRRPPKFSAAARNRMLTHPWPGNVRELRNLMERLAYLTSGDVVDVDDLAFILSPSQDASGVVPANLMLNDATRQFQTQYIQQHIKNARGNMTLAAERLGLHRSNLYRKMRQLDMNVEE